MTQIAIVVYPGFTALDFHTFHPGGRLGAKLKFVGQIMHTGAEIPLVPLEPVVVRARDGLDLVCYLSRPRDAKARCTLATVFCRRAGCKGLST